MWRRLVLSVAVCAGVDNAVAITRMDQFSDCFDHMSEFASGFEKPEDSRLNRVREQGSRGAVKREWVSAGHGDAVRAESGGKAKRKKQKSVLIRSGGFKYNPLSLTPTGIGIRGVKRKGKGGARKIRLVRTSTGSGRAAKGKRSARKNRLALESTGAAAASKTSKAAPKEADAASQRSRWEGKRDGPRVSWLDGNQPGRAKELVVETQIVESVKSHMLSLSKTMAAFMRDIKTGEAAQSLDERLAMNPENQLFGNLSKLFEQAIAQDGFSGVLQWKKRNDDKIKWNGFGFVNAQDPQAEIDLGGLNFILFIYDYAMIQIREYANCKDLHFDTGEFEGGDDFSHVAVSINDDVASAAGDEELQHVVEKLHRIAKCFYFATKCVTSLGPNFKNRPGAMGKSTVVQLRSISVDIEDIVKSFNSQDID